MQYQINNEEIGKRLDIFLTEKEEGKTRSYIKTLIEDGKVKVNDKTVKAGYLLKEQDTVILETLEDTVSEILPEEITLDIKYEDEDIIIINKPKGMVVHPAVGNHTGTLVNALMFSHLNELSSINGNIRPGIVHRIDKDTSGILVIAKNDLAHKKLSEDFKTHHLKRKYIALVKGMIKEDTFTINLPIGRNPKDRKKMAVTQQNSRNAVTHVQVLERFYQSHVTLIEATLETGRTHQIRVHLSYLGHPLIGDEVYGKKDPKFKVQGQMLHARLLGIYHPRLGNYLEFTSQPPEEFQMLLQKLRNKEC